MEYIVQVSTARTESDVVVFCGHCGLIDEATLVKFHFEDATTILSERSSLLGSCYDKLCHSKRKVFRDANN